MEKESYKDYIQRIKDKMEYHKQKGDIVPDFSLIKTPWQIQQIKAAAKLNTEVLNFVQSNIKVGMNTQEIDDLVYKFTTENGGKCAPYGYEGFPKNVCTSINEEVCHGIPSRLKKLKSGDIINVDVSTIVQGYYGDASRMFEIGEVSEERKRLVKVTKECLKLGIEAAKPWGYIGDIGAAISEHAHKNGYSVVTKLGGHGIGLEFHEEPFVSHVGTKGTGMLLVPGMIFTIEPMINVGTPDVVIDKYNGWTIYTKDGKDSAQVEHQILICEDGAEIISY
ncbi:MAG: type I methionyl aminopeptidase [Erysipelotrichaceae bacterium]|nr:type I methionyl aminopeptidase [Erysipelotrichaceae bacterium]